MRPRASVERAQLDAVLRSSDRMFRLIGDLLDVTRAGAGALHVTPTPCAADALVADALVAEAVGSHRALGAARGIAIDGHVAPGLPDVCADPDRVAQVFSNLIGNALQCTPAGGRVTVSAARATPGDAPGDGVRHQVRFAVRDTGPGIIAADQAHVFDRFWQVRKTAQLGTGLGLSTVQSLVRAQDCTPCGPGCNCVQDPACSLPYFGRSKAAGAAAVSPTAACVWAVLTLLLYLVPAVT